MLALLIIGDEILSGRIVEENMAYMIRHFSAAGYAPEEIRVVRDRVVDIAEAASSLSARFDFVVTTGGVGPTHDDVTYEGIARAFGLILEKNEQMTAYLSSRHGGSLDPGVQRMVYLPTGAEVIENSDRRWPVVRVRNCFLLPGLPGALRDKVHRVIALLPPREPMVHGNVYLATDEATVSTWLSELQKQHPTILIGSYPIFEDGAYLTKVSVTAATTEYASSLLATIAEKARFNGWLKGVDDPRPIGDDK